MSEVIEHSVAVEAQPNTVWRALTDPSQMARWMAEPEVQVEIDTTWRVGTPILVRGFHHLPFENRGIVLLFEPHSVLRYSHLSSLSRLPDQPENYSMIEFRLSPTETGSTLLTIRLSDFPNVPIMKHLDFYWRATLHVLKRVIESHNEPLLAGRRATAQ
jgi:uncharacterized protein YndB with AHSA1/START domain